MEAVERNTAWVVGYTWDMMPTPRFGSLIARTTNGGADWTFQFGAGFEHVFTAFAGISAVDADTAWAVGRNVDYRGASILKTTDGGATWSPQRSGDSMTGGVYAVDASTAWVTSSEETGFTILKTTDGGAGRDPQVSLPPGTRGARVWAVDSNTAWTAGVVDQDNPWGFILKTEDGSTWVEQDPGVNSGLQGISAVDPNIAWAAGTDGLILHTVDGGAGEPVPCLKSMFPWFGLAGTTLSASNISGSGFHAGAVVRLEKSGSPPIQAKDVTVVSGGKITCRLDLAGAAPGLYDAVVENPNGKKGRLKGAFTVWSPCGGGTYLSLFGLALGLLSIAGLGGMTRRTRR